MEPVPIISCKLKKQRSGPQNTLGFPIKLSVTTGVDNRILGAGMQIKIENVATQKEALQWFIEHRRADVPFSQAIRVLRFALCGDRASQALLDQMEHALAKAKAL